MMNESSLLTDRTAENNHYMVEALDEFNKEHILPILFDQANVSSISAYGPVGDSRVSDARNEEEKEKRENLVAFSFV